MEDGGVKLSLFLPSCLSNSILSAVSVTIRSKHMVTRDVERVLVNVVQHA